MDFVSEKLSGTMLLKVDEKGYIVSFPLQLVQEVEKVIGRSLKAPSDWMKLEPSEFKPVLVAGLKLNHAEDADSVAEAVTSILTPETAPVFLDFIFCAAWPKAYERLCAARDKYLAGNTDPKAQSGDSPSN